MTNCNEVLIAFLIKYEMDINDQLHNAGGKMKQVCSLTAVYSCVSVYKYLMHSLWKHLSLPLVYRVYLFFLRKYVCFYA